MDGNQWELGENQRKVSCGQRKPSPSDSVSINKIKQEFRKASGLTITCECNFVLRLKLICILRSSDLHRFILSVLKSCGARCRSQMEHQGPVAPSGYSTQALSYLSSSLYSGLTSQALRYLPTLRSEYFCLHRSLAAFSSRIPSYEHQFCSIAFSFDHVYRSKKKRAMELHSLWTSSPSKSDHSRAWWPSWKHRISGQC